MARGRRRSAVAAAAAMVVLVASLAPSGALGGSRLLGLPSAGAETSRCFVAASSPLVPSLGRLLSVGRRAEKDPKPWYEIEAELDRLVGGKLPFQVELISPPPNQPLGYEYLDSKTSRGDVITVQGSEAPVVVRRVRYLYDFIGGKYKVRTKILEVSTPRRHVINEQLEQMMSVETEDDA
eukprot:CAMPEP_0203968274 /NCGR_PEP_ID=MMETSP0359-20131031/96869_1 /ASSEMBLY_ACC=CAM_ASM_000338 /TAXON_ID=268821 /ORGANISM="Scrippsiella Hangoei, Strain SHTV-5" /LENGTH=179 /DNA_ID=CAMNT_0050906199 /DNA_START=72 /DNA_END=611 /DNA_ORIENTATION=+